MEADVQAVAEPSPAEFEVPTGAARDQWLRTGKLPAPKIEESAASDAPKVEKSVVEPEKLAESVAEPEPAKESQEQKEGDRRAGSKLSAEDRIRQLNAEKKAEKARADTLEARIQALERGKDAKTVESSPTTPGNYEEWKKSFDPDTWMETWQKDHPDASFGKVQLALSDHIYQVRRTFESRDQMVADLDRKWQTQISELGKLYPEDQEAASKVNDAAGRIANDPKVPLVIKQYTADSDIVGHLLYALTEKQLDQFIELSKSNPRQALKNLVLLERETEQLLKPEKVADTPRNERGQFVPEKKAPAKQISDAPPPPKDVSGKGTTSGDELEQAVKDDDLDSFRAIANRRDIARRKGQ